MNIPLYTLLILYGVVIFLYIAFSLISLYHIIRTASFTTAGFIVTFFIFAAGILTIYGSWYMLRGTDWSQSMIFFSNDTFTDSPIGVPDF